MSILTPTPKIEVRIEPRVLADILLAVHLTPVEVSGLGEVEKNGDIYTFSGEPILFEQTCSMTRTDFVDGYGRWQHALMMADREKEIERFRLWWHSHVHMPTGFSSQDEATISGWANAYDEWWFSLIANKLGEINLRIDIFKPVRLKSIYVKDFSMTEKLTRDEMKGLMLERQERMRDIVRRNVTIFEGDTLDRILTGVYGE